MELINTKSNSSIYKFNGERYSVWKSRVIGLIDESILDDNALKIVEFVQCPQDIELSDWKIWNKVSTGIIMRSLGNSTLHHATKDRSLSTYAILKAMDENYLRTSTTSEMSVDMKLMRLRCDDTKPLSEHFDIFDELVDDLQAETGEPLREANKCARLLRTLPKAYENVVVAIETVTNSELNLSFVKKRLLDFETKLKDEHHDTSAKVLHVSARPMIKRFKKNYKVIKNVKKNINNKKNAKCFHCGRSGHFKKDCFHYLKQNPQQQYQKKLNPAQQANTNESEGFAFMIGYKALNTTDSCTFLLDSGASDHVIKDYQMFEEYTTINPPMRINTAQDGGFINSTKKGIVKLLINEKTPIVLENVLYCEKAVHNLLSVHKMIKAGIDVQFISNGIKMDKNDMVIVLNTIEGKLPFIKFILNKNHKFSRKG